MKRIFKLPNIFRIIGFNIVILILIYSWNFITPFDGLEKSGYLQNTALVTKDKRESNVILNNISKVQEIVMNNGYMLRGLDEIYDEKTFHKKEKKQQKTMLKDSNRAFEEQIDENFNKFWNANEIIALFSKSQDLKMRDPLLEVTFLDKCGNLSNFRNVDVERKAYPDLILQLKKFPTTFYPPPTITLKDAGYEVRNNTILEKFNSRISNHEVYQEDEVVKDLLRNMATMPIIHIAQKSKGTQLKLLATFQDSSQAILKPMRFDRNQERKPNHFFYNDFERHTSEIAAFHLDRILGFRRCAPVIGREISISRDIYSTADEKELLRTFFISPAGNLCFHGKCRQYCDTSHAICGRPDLLEVSVAALLPSADMGKTRSPWRRSYHKRKKAIWETDDDYCQWVRQNPLYNNNKRLADLVDQSILDFLAGNMDRHHFEVFKPFGVNSFILNLDNGRGFGKPHQDEISILAPLYQCCFMHMSTFKRLVELQHTGPPISTLMFCSLHKDPLNPILLQKHFDALDRRLEIILDVIRKCLQKVSAENVFYKYTGQ